MRQAAAWALAGLALTFIDGQAQRSLTPIDWKQVDQGLGKPGALQPDGAYKVELPRGDLHVTAAGVTLKPALALGSWVAFKQVSDTTVMLMGDLVLLEPEVAPVLAQLQQAGIEQTALHNHLLQESPRVMYLHIAGRGTPSTLAAAVHAALSLTGTPFGAPPAPAANEGFGIDTAQIAGILGYHGKVNGGVYQVAVPRGEQVTADGIESPRLLFMHYWANDDALKLARGLRAALDRMNVRK